MQQLIKRQSCDHIETSQSAEQITLLVFMMATLAFNELIRRIIICVFGDSILARKRRSVIDLK